MNNYIIIIDTALETATVAICNNNQIVSAAHNFQSNSHASFVHTSLQQLLQQQQIQIQKIQAIAVVHGPGSYTGIRIGLSAAKGFCFSLQIPLITISTVELLAYAAQQIEPQAAYYIPLIDARRMEAFTAIYNHQLQALTNPFATVITTEAFEQYYTKNTTVFIGNAVTKATTILQHNHIIWLHNTYTIHHLAQIANQKLQQQQYSNIANTEPLYGKAFFDNKKN